MQVLLAYLPAESSLARALYGEQWPVRDHLLAMLVDGVHTLIWHNTADGHKGKNPPKRVPRPGEKPSKDETTFGKGSARPLVDIDALLAPFGPGGDDVSLSKSGPRTSTSSRQRAASKRTSPKSSPQ